MRWMLQRQPVPVILLRHVQTGDAMNPARWLTHTSLLALGSFLVIVLPVTVRVDAGPTFIYQQF